MFHFCTQENWVFWVFIKEVFCKTLQLKHFFRLLPRTGSRPVRTVRPVQELHYPVDQQTFTNCTAAAKTTQSCSTATFPNCTAGAKIAQSCWTATFTNCTARGKTTLTYSTATFTNCTVGAWTTMSCSTSTFTNFTCLLYNWRAGTGTKLCFYLSSIHKFLCLIPFSFNERA